MSKKSKAMMIIAASLVVLVILGIVFRSDLANFYNDHYLYIPLEYRSQAKKDAVVARKAAVDSIKKKYGKNCEAKYDKGFVDYKYSDYYNVWWITVETEDGEEITVTTDLEYDFVIDDFQLDDFFRDINRSFKSEIGIPRDGEIYVELRFPYGGMYGENGLEYKYESKGSLREILDQYYAHGDQFSNGHKLPLVHISVYSDDMKYNMQEKFEERIQESFGKYPVWITMYDCNLQSLHNPEYDEPVFVYSYEKNEISDEVAVGDYSEY